MSPFTLEVQTALAAKLDPGAIETRSQAGRSLSYVASHHVIREANRIFGFGAWSSATLEVAEVQNEQKPASSGGGVNFYIGYTARVRVTVGNTFYDGVGFGQGIDKDLGKAHESAIKEAESDAQKRALRHLGDQFGLALYDKTQEYVDKPEYIADETVQSADRLLREGGFFESPTAREDFGAFKKVCTDKGLFWPNVVRDGINQEGCSTLAQLVSFADQRLTQAPAKQRRGAA